MSSPRVLDREGREIGVEATVESANAYQGQVIAAGFVGGTPVVECDWPGLTPHLSPGRFLAASDLLLVITNHGKDGSK